MDEVFTFISLSHSIRSSAQETLLILRVLMKWKMPLHWKVNIALLRIHSFVIQHSNLHRLWFNLLTNILLSYFTSTRMNKWSIQHTLTLLNRFEQSTNNILSFSLSFNWRRWSSDVNLQTKCRSSDQYHYGTSNYRHHYWSFSVVLATPEEYF